MKILSKPKGNAEEYGRWSVNPYIGCPNGCLYCYLKSGPSGGYLGQPKAVLKKGIVSEDHAYHLAMVEILENREQIIRDGGLFMTFTSDPFLRETRSLFLGIAKASAHHGIPVIILTKCGADCVGRKFEDGYSDSLSHKLEFDLATLVYGQIAVGWTLTGYDELEPNASPSAERIKAMKIFSEQIRYAKFSESIQTPITAKMFFGKDVNIDPKIWASIEPVIDFDSSFRMIQQALDAGCEHFKIGLMTKNTKVCRHGFTLGGKTFDPYDPARCLAFVQDVMVATAGRATVYWKQSFREFIGGTGKHRLFSADDLYRIFDDYPNAVGKGWSIFAPSPDSPTV
jgi:hypothetical protein